MVRQLWKIGLFELGRRAQIQDPIQNIDFLKRKKSNSWSTAGEPRSRIRSKKQLKKKKKEKKKKEKRKKRKEQEEVAERKDKKFSINP